MIIRIEQRPTTTAPDMSLDDQALIEEAMDQLGDVLAFVRGDIDEDGITARDCVEQAREAMNDARKVLTRYLRRAEMQR